MALTPFSSVDRSALRWQRTNETPMEFTLSSGDAPVAVVRWHQAGGSLASADLSDGQWTLKRGGFLNPHITVRRAGGGDTLARLTAHLSHHQIELSGGATYRFHRAGVLVPAWKLTALDGTEVLHIEPVREGRKLEGGAVVAAGEGASLPELLLLVVLAWYFIVLAWFEDEALVPLEGT